ncbi:MAG: methyltransferase domain-containing protein [Bacteroidota bacterium]
MEPSCDYAGSSNVSLSVPPRQFNPNVLEMMDRPDADVQMLRDDLKNLRVINKLFGGLSAVRKNILPLMKYINDGQEIRILDLATGSADHPIQLVELAQKLNRRVHITGVDRNPMILEVSRERTRGYPNIVVEQQDLLNLNIPARSYDIVLCSLAIHHFSRADAVRILKQMDRLSRVGFIVNDLHRTWVAAWMARLYTHLTTRNPMTLFDTYVSVLRGFTPAELSEMAVEAGIKKFTIRKEPFFRLLLIAEH